MKRSNWFAIFALLSRDSFPPPQCRACPRRIRRLNHRNRSRSVRPGEPCRIEQRRNSVWTYFRRTSQCRSRKREGTFRLQVRKPFRRLVQRLLIVLWLATGLWQNAQAQQLPVASNSKFELSTNSRATNLWEGGIGEGFRPTTESLELGAGATYGLAAFGSHQAHDLALVSLSYGHMLGDPCGEGHWYHGNLELRLELFTGAQFSPSSEWFVGLTPHLRYSFATGTPWVPFCDGGAGVTATSIGPPDLSGTFEFNLQGGGGLYWFIRDNLALTLEAHYVHWSCAGISKPNFGLNGINGMLGLTCFF